MTKNISAELVSIGTEILLGEITDTNSVYMARNLRDVGINVFYMVSVGDNRQRIADTIRTSLERSDIVITCGGLGPTVDDMTRQSIADATDRDLVFHQDLLDQIAARFGKFRIKMTENNKQQAYLPADAIPVHNPVGTAPAFIVEVGYKCVISLPGVPREMKFLMQEQIIPYLRDKYKLENEIILARILKTAGIGESTLDTLIGREILEANNPTVGLAAHSGQIDIRITAKADTRIQAQAMIDPVENAIREQAGTFIFGADDDRLENIFATMLQDHGATLALSETGSGGIIHQRLSATLGESIIHTEVFNTPEDLQAAYKLNESLSLQDTASQAANQLREQSQSSVCILIVSRPDVDESADSDAATVVTVCTRSDTRQRIYGFGGKSENIQQFVGNWSTAVAWRMTRELFEHD